MNIYILRKSFFFDTKILILFFELLISKTFIMKKNLFFLILMSLSFFGFSQETEEKPIKMSFSGYVKNDFFWDSRKTVAAREGHFLFWPAAVSEDADGNDPNAKPNFNFLSVQSQLSLKVTGPDAFGAATTAVIESDFFAQANDNINLLRLRHAYIKLNWTNTELLTGQYWIPMFIPGCFPATVSFNTGSPIQPFGRNPQIRLTQKVSNLKLIAIASSQRDYSNAYDVGFSGEYLRNSAIPEMSLQIHYEKEKLILAGVGASYKKIIPQLVTKEKYATKEGVSGYTAIAFLNVKTAPVTMKFEAAIGQNAADALMISGFAVKDSTDKVRGFVEYSPISTSTFWTDIHTNGTKFQVGLFGGYTKNMGSADEVYPTLVYGFGTNIESLYRVAPRLVWNSGSFRVALEGEYTAAKFGKTRDANGVPTDLTEAKNMRVLLGLYYFFK